MTRPMPAAEVDISTGLVRRLLAAQHPDLADLPAEFMANGWDNVMFRLGDGLVVRMPRRRLGARILVHEQRWLPVLAPRLPLPIPAPVRTGRPGEGYPWPWSVVPFLPGRPAAAVPGYDPLRAWESSVSAPRWNRAPVWLHGDLHPANILVHDGRVSGVIDFGDITSGDPATDLAVAWMLLPAACHDAFRAAYRDAGGPLDDPLWARARGWALRLGLVFLAHSADNPQLHEVGRRTLAAAGG